MRSVVHEPATKADPIVARHLGNRLIRAGVDRGIVAATADIDLPSLVRRTTTQLTLVPDVDECPETPDEAASTAYFLERLRRGPSAHIEFTYPTLGGDAA